MPQVATDMAEVVTAHAELSMMHIRDRRGAFGKQHSADELASARRRHSTAIAKMRLHCHRLTGESRTRGGIALVN